MANKWGGRLLSNAEKTQADKEIEAYVRDLFKTPISKKGKQSNAVEWIKTRDGWYRRGDGSMRVRK